MIILLSPAKTFTNNFIEGNNFPLYIDKTNYLVNILKSMDTKQLETNLKISNKLAKNVYKYYHDFNLNYAAVYLYGGQAYKYLKALDINKKSLKKLYIISPLYGIISALDKISLYRLDLKDKITSSSLYNYWYQDINDFLDTLNNKIIINLASGEFSRLINLKKKNIITINFAVIKENKLLQQSMLLKKMRGMMANYLLVNNVNDIADIKKISLDGFKYNKTYSDEQTILFTINKQKEA